MIKLLRKFEYYLGSQSLDARYPFNLYALKTQVRIHKLFPSIFPNAPSNRKDFD